MKLLNMKTNKIIVHKTRKYVLGSSTLHNIANVDQGITIHRQCSISSKKLVKTGIKHNKYLKVPLSAGASNFKSTGVMQLRSQMCQKHKSKDENENLLLLAQKNGAKKRKDPLDHDKQPKPGCSKIQKTSDKIKEPKPTGYMKTRSQTRENWKLNEPNKVSWERTNRNVTNIGMGQSLDSANQLPQIISKNRKTCDKIKEPIKSLNCKTNEENNISSRLTQKIGTNLRGTGSLDSAMQRTQGISKNHKTNDKFRKSADCSTELSQESLKKPTGYKYLKVIENVLSEAHLNLKDRFYIKSIPRCGENFQHCQTIHSEKIQICDYYSKNSTKMLLAETRVLNFLKALDGMIFRDVFPGVELIIELIGTILTYDSIDKTSTNECILSGSLNTLHRIMFKFPPCIINIKILFQNLLTESCYKSDIISLPNFEFQNGIFWKLIEMLEVLIENDVEDDDILNLSQQSEDGFDFYTWEKRQITQHYRHNIPRDDKIDRIFYLLHFLTDLMECEFANWFQRHHFDNKNDQPIITSVIWQSDLPGTITINVKRIISLFTKFVAVDFPENKIKIFSSLLTLIGNVMLYVTAKNDFNIYPNRNFNCIESLSKEMFKIVTDIQPSIEYSKVKLYSLIVTHLELPALKMLFGNVVIDKIENLYTHNLSLEKLHRILINDSWKIVIPKQITKSPNKTKIRNLEGESSGSLYPIYSKNSHKSGTSCENINFDEYIIVIFQTFKSYLNYFKLDTILREIHDPFHKKPISLSSCRTRSPIKKENDNCTSINFKLAEKHLNKLPNSFKEYKMLNKSNKATFNNKNIPKYVKFDNTSLRQYHLDIEFFDQILKCIQTGKDVYFKLFKEFLINSNLVENI